MKKILLFGGAIFILAILAFSAHGRLYAQSEPRNDGAAKVMRVFVDGSRTTIATQAKTVGEALESSGIELFEHDKSEPSVETEITSNEFNVTIFRARPITVVDGANNYTITTAERTPRAIAETAGFKPKAEDGFEYKNHDNPFEGTIGTHLYIKRSKEITFELYGKSSKLRTQTLTVQDLLDEKEVTLEDGDEVTPSPAVRITNGMKVSIASIDKKVRTVEETIPFPEEQIQDANQPLSYKKITEPGENGSKLVTYEIIVRNGEEFKKKALKTVVTKQPVKQVAIVGAKNVTFSGDFALALAKLRSCEGGYDSWNPAGPYYGAYQFDRQTWGSVADPAKYGHATPGEQDAAARALYEQRGWQPWPVCGASLPDIYR